MCDMEYTMIKVKLDEWMTEIGCSAMTMMKLNACPNLSSDNLSMYPPRGSGQDIVRNRTNLN